MLFSQIELNIDCFPQFQIASKESVAAATVRVGFFILLILFIYLSKLFKKNLFSCFLYVYQTCLSI